MSFTKNIIIECSRENAENVKITQAVKMRLGLIKLILIFKLETKLI